MSTVYNLPQLSYQVAYYVLPHYAFQAVEKAIEMWTKTPTAAGPYYYLIACRMAELEPVPEDARLYSTSLGTLDDYDYYLMEYPTPPPFNPAGADVITLADAGVLAPHFSIIVRHRVTNEIHYFVLGQSPIGGGTTFRTVAPAGVNANLGPSPGRTVSAAGVNANLGPGPAPQRNLFLDRVRQALNA